MADSGRVLIDTSVWVDFFRGDERVVGALGLLGRSARGVVCGQVRQEVLQGSRDQDAFAKLEKAMEVWEAEVEQPADFVEAARIFAELRWKGVTIPPSDCLIAAVALRCQLPLFASDRDFRHVPGLELYDPGLPALTQ